MLLKFLADGRWTEENPCSRFPRLTFMNKTHYLEDTDLWLMNGSYLRLKNIEVGYTLPANILKKASISKLRIFASVQNLFTITSYSGMDPEIGQSISSSTGVAGGVTASGVDVGIYPYSRFFTMGFNLEF